MIMMIKCILLSDHSNGNSLFSPQIFFSFILQSSFFPDISVGKNNWFSVIVVHITDDGDTSYYGNYIAANLS
jgi:hypothetical protein